MWVGFLLCLDCFLFEVTYLPIRVVAGCVGLGQAVLGLRPASAIHLSDVMRGLLCCVAVYMLLSLIDPSYIYHEIRGQVCCGLGHLTMCSHIKMSSGVVCDQAVRHLQNV